MFFFLWSLLPPGCKLLRFESLLQVKIIGKQDGTGSLQKVAIKLRIQVHVGGKRLTFIMIMIIVIMAIFSGTSTEWLFVKCNLDRIGIWKCWFLSRGENRSTQRKTSRSIEENHQQTFIVLYCIYIAFSIWIDSNALYNTLWGTLTDSLMALFTIFLM